MSIIQRFVRKPEPSEAVQLTRSNYKEVANWCGGGVIEEAKASDPTDVYIGVIVPHLQQKGKVWSSSTKRANVGDWIMRYPTGKFTVLEDHYFRENYVPEAEVIV